MNTATKISIGVTMGIIFATALMFFSFMNGQYQNVGASVGVGNSYVSTSTDSTWDFAGGVIGNEKNLLGTTTTQQGILGSIVITTSTPAPLTIYDATTTNIALRNNVATSTLVLANMGVSVAAGTYTFDVRYKNGLIAVYSPSLGVASSTITFRNRE